MLIIQQYRAVEPYEKCSYIVHFDYMLIIESILRGSDHPWIRNQPSK